MGPTNNSKHPPFKEVEAGRPDYRHAHEPIWTKVPDPDFQPGQGLNSMPQSRHFDPKTAKYRSIKPEEHEKGDIYRVDDDIGDCTSPSFMSIFHELTLQTPRPVAFMSTMGADGSTNLAPMSYFSMVAHDPPTISISIQASSKNADGLKDSNSNIRQIKEFCCSIISEPFLEAMNYTSIDAPYEIDEWKLSGLTKRASEVIKTPHVAESAFSMECELMHWYEIKNDEGEKTNTVILGRVRRFHVVRFELIQNEYCFSGDELKLSPEKLMPVARLGGITYARTTDLMELPRPVWDNVKDDPKVNAALEGPAKSV